MILQFEVCRYRPEQVPVLGRRTRPRKPVPGLSIVVYGPIDYSVSVGTFLLKCKLYLQDPQRWNLKVPYRNPQSLWDPEDGDMRMIQDTAIGCEADVFEAAPDLLQGLEYEDELPKAKQPSALKSQLHA